MAILGEKAKLIRSKNAGPFELTFDIMFDSLKDYQEIKKTKLLNRELISRLYHVPTDKIRLFEYDEAYAFKITIPRPYISGNIDDTDVFGGQQYGPLVTLEIPNS
jgi:hypothetical protein